jgi:hypothetical protein
LLRDGAACRVFMFTLVGFIDWLDAGGFLQKSVIFRSNCFLKSALVCPSENSAINKLQGEFACVHPNASSRVRPE